MLQNELNLSFNYKPITYGEIKAGGEKPLNPNSIFYKICVQANDKDKCIADTRKRIGEKASAFQTRYIRDDEILPTIRTKPDIIDISNISYVSKDTIINAQTFPQDYDFSTNSFANIGYICGMSVPPLMIKRLVEKLIKEKVYGTITKN